MKRLNGISVAATVVLAVLGLLIFILNGWRADMADADQQLRNHERRVTVLETNYENIKAMQQEIKDDLKDIKRAVGAERD